MKRSTKFYRKNEKEVMKELGFAPTINSGAGWVQKEDGENSFALCQLKSTEKSSISIKNSDLRTLELNSVIAHKIPVFAIQFLDSGDVWVMVRPADLETLGMRAADDDPFVEDMLGEDEEKTEICEKSLDNQNKEEYNVNIETARKQFWSRKQEEKREKERDIKEWRKNCRKRGSQVLKE